MTLCNRVTPLGELIATPARGTLMGNRGVLHDDAGEISRLWRGKRWITCLLEIGGRRRELMRPGHYTELFFLDEATALAAGHRPCAECRRDWFDAFRWGVEGREPPPSAEELDRRLHAERVGPDGAKVVHRANPEDLPDGVFVLQAGEANLVWGQYLLSWSPVGYRGRLPRPVGGEVVVLTPATSIMALRRGYVPAVHPSVVASK